jgi:hypothetical protein
MHRLTQTKVWLVIALAGAVLFAGASQRASILRTVGWILVASDPIEPADIIIIAQDAGGAGVLEASDLVRKGVAERVAVFADPPSGEDFEFLRRGLPYEDAAARQIRQLGWLGITNVVKIAREDEGSTASVQSLPVWCGEHQVRSFVFVTSKDHSWRLRRLLNRTLGGAGIRAMVQPEHYSAFDPDHWSETRAGTRIVIAEIQKLLVDILLHPFPDLRRQYGASAKHGGT